MSDRPSFATNSSTVAGNGVGGINIETLNVAFSIFNSTISDNDAVSSDGSFGGNGGAAGFDGDGSTVSATAGSDGSTSAGGIVSFSDLMVTTRIVLKNPLVAGSAGNRDVYQSFQPSSNFNLVGNGDGSDLVNPATIRVGSASGSGILSANPGVLRNNGGTIRTHALLPGILAIGNGSSGLFPGGLTLDQRTASRIDRWNGRYRCC